MIQTIPRTMFAWRKHRGNMKPIWEQVSVSQAPPTGFLVKMLAAGVCRSDHNLTTNEDQPAWFQDRFTLGHEGCGTIVEIGSHIPSDAGFEIGDVIALLAVPGCGERSCDECKNELQQLCQRGHHSGIGQDGFFAPYATIDVRGAVKVPKGVTPSQAAVATDAVTTAYHAIHRRGQIQSHETVFLFGLGGLGFNALQILRAIGARVLVSDVKQDMLDAARDLGVHDEDIVPIGKDVKEWCREKGWFGKVDVTADFVGVAQTFSDAQFLVRQAGRMLCVGTLNHHNEVHMKIGIRKRLTIIFSYGGQTRDLEDVLELIARGVLDPMVRDAKIGDLPIVMDALQKGEVKGRIALVSQPKPVGKL
ncbi:N-benzyl-3-pyrrolidinol dehydrogenase [Lophiostoma macrostomum CBS 122681]|uniref:N-benzyl-3-pyrrolidinol dehydrogenase n=1 Tax=Lophiostoma macrostomum CBS 122681 TaxID=1314788 RepID=A0A6A6SS31_9PLEO|nr:N-benzyl-3-pyrrolidinol dehydrogenase [Lophiostoma macrostomum CBS 122681]